MSKNYVNKKIEIRCRVSEEIKEKLRVICFKEKTSIQEYVVKVLEKELSKIKI